MGDVEKAKYALQEVCDIYTDVFGYKPEFFMCTLGMKLYHDSIDKD